MAHSKLRMDTSEVFFGHLLWGDRCFLGVAITSGKGVIDTSFHSHEVFKA
ncbi:hypothetical protein [Calothrix sp. 336/3]|nr:hypothetical protein [Calothrix sp. 336/3]